MNPDVLLLILAEVRTAVRRLTLLLAVATVIAAIDGLYNLGLHR